ncbi:MAG: U32 family peptidase, partial [Bacilli bacterium]|nr:U32 family peptidase [Bacilli bacterium]
MKKIEVLAPVGNRECLTAAIQAGCDAVYLGGLMFGARNFAGNFTIEELTEAVTYAHLYGVKVYVTVNTLVYENEIPTLLEYVDQLVRIPVDALIIQDIGVLDLIHQTYPDLELHA